jgi:hypothetical protein
VTVSFNPDEDRKIRQVGGAFYLAGIYGYLSVAGKTTQREAIARSYAIEVGGITLVVVLGLNPIGGTGRPGISDLINITDPTTTITIS